MATPDIHAAIVKIIDDNAAVTTLVGTKVFGLELPNSEAQSMPQNAVVVQPAGGVGLYNNLPLADPRVAIRSYGSTPAQALLVHNAVYDALKAIESDLKLTVWIHAAMQAGGPMFLREPNVDWPLVLSSWTVIADETPV